jgi:hypothetical protein
VANVTVTERFGLTVRDLRDAQQPELVTVTVDCFGAGDLEPGHRRRRLHERRGALAARPATSLTVPVTVIGDDVDEDRTNSS